MNRKDFIKLARLRLREAKALLDHHHPEGSYYLAGYVVECALKACIAKKTKKYEFPDKELVNASYTHKLSRLIEIAGLSTLLDAQSKMDKQFEVNWSTVKNWNENSRYMSPSKQEADDIYKAIANKKHGVISWIRQHW